MSDYMDSLYENLNDESLAAITAGAGYNDGANNGFWRIQPRLPKFREGAGQWMEMGAEIRAAFKKLGQIMSRAGKVVGSGGTSDTVRVLHPAEPERGLPEEIKIYPTTAVELIGARLSPEYLRSIGRDPNATGTGISAMSNPDNLPNYEDLPTAPVTDDDRRLAEQGLDSPEGQEMSQYKDSPEGQEVARLEDTTEADVLDTPAEIAEFMDGGDVQPKRYKGLKEISPGVFEYKEGKDRHRIRQNKAGKWEIYDEASNSDYDFDSAADRRGAKDSWYKLDSGAGYDSVEDVMENFFAVEPIAPRGGSKAPAAPAPVEMDMSKAPDLDLSDVIPLSDANDAEKAITAQIAKAADEIAALQMNASTSKDAPEALRKAVEGLDLTDVRPGYLESLKTVNESLGQIDNRVSQSTQFGRENEAKIAEAALAKLNAPAAPAEAAEPKKTLKDFAGFDAIDRAYAETIQNSVGDINGDNFDQDVYGPRHTEALQAIKEKFSELERSDLPDSEIVPEFKDFVQNVEGIEEGVRDDLLANIDFYDKENQKKIAEDGLSDVQASEIDAADLFQRAMDGEDVGLDDIMGRKKDDIPDEGDEEEEEEDTGDKEPTEADLLDIEAELEAGFDEDADWNEQRTGTERVSASDINPGDFVIDPDGDVARVEDVQELPDGSINFTTVNYDGGPETSFNKNPESSVSLVEFGDPADSEPDAPSTPAPITPDVTPADDEEEYVPTPAPDTARTGYAGEELEVGDEVYTNNGADLLGTIFSVRKNPLKKGEWEIKLADPEDGRPERGWREYNQDTTLVNKPGGEKTPEVAEPEVPANRFVDEETANAAGFTRSSRDMLRGMKATRDDPMRQAYGKALANGRTSVIAQDIDGSWHLEKHDEFNGGIKETKGFETLQEALDEGNAFLENRDPKFDANPEPEPVVLTEPEPEVPAAPTPDSGALPVAPARPSKKPKVKKTSRVADPDDVVKPAPMETDDGTSDIEFNSPPPPGGPGGPGDGGGPNDPNNPLNIRNAKVDVLRDENGNIIYEADEDGNPIYDDKGKKIPMLDTEAVKALVKKFFPNAKQTADGLGITIWRQTIDGNTFDMSIKRTDRGDHIITVGVTDESGERKEYISVAPRKSWTAVWNLREDGGGNSPFAIYNLITGAAKIGSTGGKDYFKLPTALERFQYYRAQKSNWPGVSRFATVAELFEGIANGRKEKLNFSLPKKPGTSRRFTMEEWMSPENEANRLANETWLTVRASEVGSLKDAIETGLATGDWSGAYFLMLNMKGKFPQDIDSLASLRTMLNKYLKDALPNANHRRLAGVITTFSNLVRSGLKNPSKLETPYIGADGHTEIKEGMWVKYKNILNEWSVGKVVRRRPSDDIARPTQSPDQAGYQHHDQVVVEFANGETVDQITAEHLFPLDKKDKDYGKPTKYQGKPSKKRRQSEREALAGLASMFADIDDPSEEPEPEAEKPSAGPTKVDDLTPGSTLYSKSGVPLGEVVEVTPITADNGKRGFAIAYIDANGDTKVVKVAAGELRGPKA